MSDEDSPGQFCAIRRTTYVLIVALGFLLYGIYHALYFIMYGGPRCNDIFTCDASKESSYHARLCIMAIGSLVFGITGVNSIYNKYGEDMFKFAWWLLIAAMVYFIVALWDAGYGVLCGDVYSYNVIMETVMWPIDGLPVYGGIKHEIRSLHSYPIKYVDALAHHNVAFWFGIFTLVKVALFSFSAYQAYELAHRFHYGAAGMGANFSIESWKKRLMLRYEVDEVAYNTFDMAYATGMDVGWTQDEFQLQRPLQRPHWYRGGMMPPAAARAYDGFSDSRQNVLL